jgi:hypothetical protein
MYTLVFMIRLKLSNVYAICFLNKSNIGYVSSFLIKIVNLNNMNINVFLSSNLIKITRNIKINA